MRRWIIVLVPVEQSSGCFSLLVLLLLAAIALNFLGQNYSTQTTVLLPTDTPSPTPNWTHVSRQIRSPIWSPDSEEIAYIDNNDIWVMEVASGSKRNLTSGVKKPKSCWDPRNLIWLGSGDTLAFLPCRNYQGSTSLGVFSLKSKEMKVYSPEWLETKGLYILWIANTADNRIVVVTFSGVYLADTKGNLVSNVYFPTGKPGDSTRSFGSVPDGIVLMDNKLLLWGEAIRYKTKNFVVLVDLQTLQEQLPPYDSASNTISLNELSVSKKWATTLSTAYSHSGNKMAKGTSPWVMVTDLNSRKSCEIRISGGERLKILWSPDDSKLLFFYQTGGGWDDAVYDIGIAEVCA